MSLERAAARGDGRTPPKAEIVRAGLLALSVRNVGRIALEGATGAHRNGLLLVPMRRSTGESALDGGPSRPKEQVVSSNALLHDELLALLNQE
jgi:hypothetical protein